jgi:hypothetical protein
VEHYLIIARSVTHAQRMERALERAGIRAQLFRAPMELTNRGCAYAVQIDGRSLSAALSAVYGAGLRPESIFYATPRGFQEVSP